MCLLFVTGFHFYFAAYHSSSLSCIQFITQHAENSPEFFPCRRQLWWYLWRVLWFLTDRASLVSWEGWVPDWATKHFAFAHIWITEILILKYSQGVHSCLSTLVSVSCALSNQSSFSYLSCINKCTAQCSPSSRPCFRQSNFIFIPSCKSLAFGSMEDKIHQNQIVPLVSKAAYLAPGK